MVEPTEKKPLDQDPEAKAERKKKYSKALGALRKILVEKKVTIEDELT
jgi:hypothetical protein